MVYDKFTGDGSRCWWFQGCQGCQECVVSYWRRAVGEWEEEQGRDEQGQRERETRRERRYFSTKMIELCTIPPALSYVCVCGSLSCGKDYLSRGKDRALVPSRYCKTGTGDTRIIISTHACFLSGRCCCCCFCCCSIWMTAVAAAAAAAGADDA